MRYACALLATILSANDALEQAQARHNAAAADYFGGRYAEAEAGFRAAMRLFEQSGERRLATVPTLTGLATILRTTGRYSEAETAVRAAIDILGPAPGTVTAASAWQAIAEIERLTGRLVDSRASILRARRLLPESGDSRDAVLLAILQSESALLLESGDIAAAESAQTRVLLLAEKLHGERHRTAAHARNGLGLILLRQNRLTEAEPLFAAAAGDLRNDPGPDHPWTCAAINNLAQVFRRQGRRSEAEPLYRQSLAATEAKLGPTHPSAAYILLNLAELFVEQDKFAGAEKLYERAACILAARLGANHDHTRQAWERLSGLYRLMGRSREAKRAYARSMAER